MIYLITIVLLFCLFNLLRRVSCIVKVKFTKFTFIYLSVVFIVFLYVIYILKYGFLGYMLLISFELLFFTSLISCGISKRGFIHPWNLIAKLYPFGKEKKRRL